MSSSDRAARSELLQTIQTQEEKLKRYEKKLHDLVIAYRNILKEKATLEETVKALSEGVHSHDSGPPGADPAASESGDEAPSDPSAGSEMARRVEALTQSLASLTEDKQRMEASYQTDRRRLMKEQEEAVSALRQELESAEIVRRELQREINELRQRVREQRVQADRADADQAAMLRELQSLLAKERSAREQLEFEVEEVRERLEAAERQQQPPPPLPVPTTPQTVGVERAEMEEYQRRIRDLSNEVEQLRGRQSATEVPLEQLKAELVAVKAEHRVQLQRELARANEAETRLAEFSRQHEERVSGLEARLTELSQTLGSYERTREADQGAITKLRERVAQLDLENSALSMGAAPARDRSPESGCSEDSLEVEIRHPQQQQTSADGNQQRQQPAAIQQQQQQQQAVSDADTEVMALLEKLQAANARTRRPLDLARLLGDTSDADPHRRCREELAQLKEEFERYKLKAQSVLLKQQAASSAPGSSSALVSRETAERAQAQAARLRERARELQEELRNEQRLSQRSQAALRRALEEAESRHADELDACQRRGEQRVAQLDEELSRHRNRTIALLAEKDEEMAGLRAAASGPGPGSASTQATLTAASMSALLRQDSAGRGQGLEAAPAPALTACAIIHCQQERARAAGEIRSLREANRGLEAAQREAALREAELRERAEGLERSARLRGDAGGGEKAASLEYLKNVVLRYMTTAEVDARRGMLRAIATILQFSPREVHHVEQFNSPGWFSR